MQHGKILLLGGGGQVHQVGNVRDHGNVKDAQVGHIVHTVHRGGEHQQGGRVVIDAQVLAQLVVGALQKGAVHAIHRLGTVGSQSAGQRYGGLLGNAHIHELFACLLTQILGKAEYGGGAGGDGHHFGVLLHFLQQIPGG